ncbi:DNA polymerase III subunit alpha [Thermanaeromonas sp. C210]|uniref:DNA polymerase III subunit alpha n=1 Tax=Thermanaeromonas sp. C210 TaxID=2731925 RepID=UPI00155B5A6F|nr:DNA polymerase III subunit alpha [Thermanaeromonas sp. C210]GFN22430.1 DNA-directed DNA polymerase [Thermanaeromonas sp. C210]
MDYRPFVHLHVHSEYSLLDGAGRLEELAAAAAGMGMPALALTDHGVMYGAVEFYKAARAKGIKPIIGCEVYVAPRGRRDREPHKDDFQYHLVLLVENETGYRNLCALVSAGFLEGFYYKPRVDRELLARHREGLLALSGCLAGEVPELLLKGQEEKARETAAWYREVFGPEGFFLEIQDQGIPEQREVNRRLVALAEELGIPLVATNDVHYVRRDQAHLHDVLLCIQTGKTLQEEDRLRFPTPEFYLKSPREMEDLFGELPAALDNTVKIAERCSFDFTLGRLHLPEYRPPGGQDTAAYLRSLCFEGLERRYSPPSEEARRRLEYELDIIEKMGYPGYFLIVWDLVNFARRRGIPVGPGRGSAAGSLVAYCLGITNIDPLRYNLLFERFLNPERVSMPDIDIDFCFERREEVIQYAREKYGEEHVAQIITFGTMAARAAVRDVGRALGWPVAEVDRVAKMVPAELGITLDRALETAPDLRRLYQSSARVRELLDTARAVEGFPRHASTHAAGIVITREPLIHYLPLQKTGDAVTTQFSMQAVEELGLLKMDLLGLRTLTVIGHTLDALRREGKAPEVEDFPLDDRATYELLSSGESTGVFQLESSGMRSILRNLRPERFEDIIALVALYRPGPLGSGMVEDFIRRKHGLTPVTYPHGDLEPVLRETYGVILYQEQVMQIAHIMAGYTLGQADELRRAMGKKKPEEMARHRSRFIQGAMEKGYDPELAARIFDLMEYFAGYGFNKSHSAAYALVAYQTAYLKAHYPVEFMAALLSSVSQHLEKVAVYLEECRCLGIPVLPPDVNESGVDFSAGGGRIRFGLAAVKNVGRAAVEAIIAAREAGGPFTSLTDFCRRVDLHTVNKRVLESLIRCGAFDSLGKGRRQLLSILDACLDAAGRSQEDRRRGQVSLFDMVEAPPDDPPLPPVEDFSKAEILAMEKELLGFYLSGHPLEPFAGLLEQKVSHTVARLAEADDGAPVVVGGVVAGLRRVVTRKGETMAYLLLEDFGGQVEVLLFPRVYARCREWLKDDLVVLVEGRVAVEEEGVKVLADRVERLEPGRDARPPEAVPLAGDDREDGDPPSPKLYLKVEREEGLEELRRLLAAYPGPHPVYFYFPRNRRWILANRQLWVSICPPLLRNLIDTLGKDRVKVIAEK